MSNIAQIRILVVAGLIALAGCNHTATSSSTTPASSTSTSASAANSSGDTSAMASANQTGASNESASNPGSASVPAANSIVVHSGTAISVTVDQNVSSKTSEPGDRFEASLAAPVRVSEHVVIPRGAKVVGTVMDSKSAGRFNGNAELRLTLSSVRVNGEKYAIKTTSYSEAGKGRGKRTAVGAGGGAVVGGLIGALAGGGKGAAIGVGAGAGAGAAGAGFTGSRDVEIQAETKLEFTLTQPLKIRAD